MCLELTKEELQDTIIILEGRLFSLQRESEMNGVLDSRLVNVKEALLKMRKELGNRY